MKLNQLFKSIQNYYIKGPKNIEITGLSSNSKVITPGNLFIVKRGKTFDGSIFIPEAVQGGAVAVLTDLYDPSYKEFTQIIHPNPSAIEAKLAATFFNHPSQQLFTVGITGTNGKTTTSYIIKHLMEYFKGPAGLIGSIENVFGPYRQAAIYTTPDVITNQQLLREMLKYKCSSVIMEVTSHALMQGRVDEICYDVAIFTNLTPEHLDYHENMEHYCSAKNKLFNGFGKEDSKHNKKWAIVNLDDPYHEKITNGCLASIITYSIEEKADLKASNVIFNRHETKAKLTYKNEEYEFSWPLIGKFNVYNCLAAVATLLSQGIKLKDLIEPMQAIPQISGRLQLVENALGLKIYVDHSHKPDALEKVLTTLLQMKEGRIITLFGCGGDRDKEKRPKMGEIAEKYSDFTVVTNDNPRSEDPVEIAKNIIKGFKNENYLVELDRKLAIEKVIRMANVDDLILIAGKGHEKYQIFAHQTIEFNDSKVAADVCSALLLEVK